MAAVTPRFPQLLRFIMGQLHYLFPDVQLLVYHVKQLTYFCAPTPAYISTKDEPLVKQMQNP